MATHIAEIKWAAKESGEEFLKGRFSRGAYDQLRRRNNGSRLGLAPCRGKMGGSGGGRSGGNAGRGALELPHAVVPALARLAGYAVKAYDDHAEGTTEEIAPGRIAVTKVRLKPKIEWAGAAPLKAELDRLHHGAHEICFIANSVKTDVTVE